MTSGEHLGHYFSLRRHTTSRFQKSCPQGSDGEQLHAASVPKREEAMEHIVPVERIIDLSLEVNIVPNVKEHYMRTGCHTGQTREVRHAGAKRFHDGYRISTQEGTAGVERAGEPVGQGAAQRNGRAGRASAGGCVIVPRVEGRAVGTKCNKLSPTQPERRRGIQVWHFVSTAQYIPICQSGRLRRRSEDSFRSTRVSPPERLITKHGSVRRCLPPPPASQRLVNR